MAWLSNVHVHFVFNTNVVVDLLIRSSRCGQTLCILNLQGPTALIARMCCVGGPLVVSNIIVDVSKYGLFPCTPQSIWNCRALRDLLLVSLLAAAHA